MADSLFDEGYNRIAIIDSDSPNLPTQYILEGIEALEGADVVLGPCEDGGYYLVGLSSKLPEIFEGIPWSTPAVTEETVEITKKLGKKVTLLQQWYDVDTIDDLRRLQKMLDGSHKTATDAYYCKNTYNFIPKIL